MEENLGAEVCGHGLAGRLQTLVTSQTRKSTTSSLLESLLWRFPDNERCNDFLSHSFPGRKECDLAAQLTTKRKYVVNQLPGEETSHYVSSDMKSAHQQHNYLDVAG